MYVFDISFDGFNSIYIILFRASCGRNLGLNCLNAHRIEAIKWENLA